MPHLIDNERLRGVPLLPALAESEAHKLIHRLFSVADPRPVVNGDAANGTRRNAGGGRREGRRRGQPPQHLAQQMGLARAGPAGEEEGLTAQSCYYHALLFLREAVRAGGRERQRG
eukprot:scaffold246239_cov31-Tisochrysis_lutea.AAC.2